jgi:hypothetical protein
MHPKSVTNDIYVDADHLLTRPVFEVKFMLKCPARPPDTFGKSAYRPILNYFGFRAAKLACARSW